MPTPTGIFRRELWIDARDLQSDSDPDKPLSPEEYIAALTARGREKLAENQLVQSFSATVRMHSPTYEYGKDFFLGDTITATDDRLGVTSDAVVEGVTYAVSRDGDVMELELGYGQPTIYDILKRKRDS